MIRRHAVTHTSKTAKIRSEKGDIIQQHIDT